MTHADSLALPPIKNKQEFYTHVVETLNSLLSPSPAPAVDWVNGNWITSCSNCSSLLMGVFENWAEVWGKEDGKRINWVGFYLIPALFPSSSPSPPTSTNPPVLLLGPFQGRPACLEINLETRVVGVCASAFLSRKTVVVEDVEKHQGHIACDAASRSEIVVPLMVKNKAGERVCVGVLDVDCEGVNGFSEEDKIGLEMVVDALDALVNWGI